MIPETGDSGSLDGNWTGRILQRDSVNLGKAGFVLCVAWL